MEVSQISLVICSSKSSLEADKLAPLAADPAGDNVDAGG